MKTCIIFTGSGPILIMTTYASLTDPEFVNKLAGKGIRKFIGYELPLALVEEKYGAHFNSVMNDVHQSDDLRVLDYDGHHVFYNFSFDQMGSPVQYES